MKSGEIEDSGTSLGGSKVQKTYLKNDWSDRGNNELILDKSCVVGGLGRFIV